MNQACLVDIQTCQLCGSQEGTEMFQDPPYRVLRCSTCDLVYVTPRHNEDALHKLYGEDYWRSNSPKTRGYACYAEEEPLYLRTFRKRLELVRNHIPTGKIRVLDIGCAAGFFLRVMNEEGHDARGVEVSADIAALAIEHLGEANIHVGFLDQLEPQQSGFEIGSFDLITMWDVIEHVPDPQALLQQAHKLLKPDGALILETQNVDSRFAGILGKKWQHFKHEEHLYHFNPKTITRLLVDTGYQVVRNTPKFGGKYVSLGFIAERAGRISKIAGLLCKPLNLLKRLSLYLNLRDEMIVVARPGERTSTPKPT